MAHFQESLRGLNNHQDDNIELIKSSMALAGNFGGIQQCPAKEQCTQSSALYSPPRPYARPYSPKVI
jgi:hypothetical protein